MLRSNSKLTFRFFGPFQVEHKVGVFSYLLKPPEGSKLHPVFHFSQPRKGMTTKVVHQSQLRKGMPPEVVHQGPPWVDAISPQR